MIPVEPYPEPGVFQTVVREPGRRFLLVKPHPVSIDWRGYEYWRLVLPHMRVGYCEVCSYSATWIPASVGCHSVDHFIPKSQNPTLAYEWTNYRYVSARFNARKGIKSIVDPFTLQPGCFVLDFKSFLIFPNATLDDMSREAITQTIEILRLNSDDDLVNERVIYFNEFISGEVTFTHLKKRAPFIAFEIERQGLLNS
jgi:hypothetical protein